VNQAPRQKPRPSTPVLQQNLSSRLLTLRKLLSRSPIVEVIMATAKDVKEMLGLAGGDSAPKPAAAKKAKIPGQKRLSTFDTSCHFDQLANGLSEQPVLIAKSSPSTATAPLPSPSSIRQKPFEESSSATLDRRNGSTWLIQDFQADADCYIGKIRNSRTQLGKTT
jgi:hypothetical protein